MKSPLTGKEMLAKYEKRTWKFRGEDFEYYHQSWLCEDSGEEFTTDESDTAGFIQVTNQYRAKYGLPYTDEIIEVRKRYNISASKMALILGLGTNQYRLYEQGEVPSISNGRMIRSIENPKVMMDMLKSSINVLSEKEFKSIESKINNIIDERNEYTFQNYDTQRVFCTCRGKENGYAPISLSRLKNVLLYILEHSENVWFTKMNKMLFYIDFLSYKNRGMAISGLSYKAIQFGPVPNRWDRVYSEFPQIEQNIVQNNFITGTVLHSDDKADTSLFSDAELGIMNEVCSLFKDKTAKQISEFSHEEDAWQNHHDNREFIPFDEAFSLNL